MLPNADGKYECELCDRIFETIAALGVHRRSCDGGAWRCAWCEVSADQAQGKSPGPDGAGRTIFHANPGHGTDTESKSPPIGRASGTVRRSEDGGRTWEAAVDINGHEGYSYSCLSEVPEPGFVGVAYETVLPGSSIVGRASANNIVFTLVPQNFTNGTL